MGVGGCLCACGSGSGLGGGGCSDLLSSRHLGFKGVTVAALIPSAPPDWEGRGMAEDGGGRRAALSTS